MIPRLEGVVNDQLKKLWLPLFGIRLVDDRGEVTADAGNLLVFVTGLSRGTLPSSTRSLPPGCSKIVVADTLIWHA